MMENNKRNGVGIKPDTEQTGKDTDKHSRSPERWEHSHNFSLIQKKGEKRIFQVLLITAITMVIEIAAGNIFGSMALLADGWHMGTHVAAFSISLFAYRYARKNINHPDFSFGTGKVSVLGGFSSAVALAVVALVMALESVNRLFNPRPIYYNQAIVVAILGLMINLISALILQGYRTVSDSTSHDHKHQDYNLKAAYFHVVADALTSLLAIIALLSGKYFGWLWMDPSMGLVGAAVITRWSFGLLKDTSPILLDKSIDEDRKLEIRKSIEADSDNRIVDLHVWKVGPYDYSASISLVTHFPKAPDHYKKLLLEFEYLSHINIEVNHCEDTP